MDAEVKVALHTLREIRVGGKIAILRRARKGHKCSSCGFPIEKGEDYYCVYIGGAGLGNLKYPEHIHTDCAHQQFKIGGRLEWKKKDW